MVAVADRVSARDAEFADSQGQFLPWMAERGVHALLVRPDFFAFGGAADASGVAALVEDLHGQMAAHGMAA